MRTFASRVKPGDKTRVGSTIWEATKVKNESNVVRITWRNWAGQERVQRLAWATRVNLVD